MGNKSNRGPRRSKKQIYKDKTTCIENTTPSNITTENPMQATVVVDMGSILCPISDVQHEHNYTTHPITPSSTVYSIQEVQDPLFVIKTETESSATFNEQSNEFPNVGLMEVVVKIEPTLNEENVIQDEQNSIAFENKCRLCLTTEESNWIEIFTSEPYPFLNVDEITPSNIVEIIEQFTTIKIAKNDQLPDKICIKCFQSLRFVYKFREKSLRSQNVLTSEVNGLRKSSSEQNQQKKVLANESQLEAIRKLLRDVRMKPIRTPVPNPKKQLTFEEACNVDKNEATFTSVQCEICGQTFDKYKPFQYHMNRHNDIRPFACTEPYCDKSYYSPQNLKSHFFNSHTAQSLERKFKCDLCGKTCNRPEKLKHHRAIHFPPTIPCTICGKLLRSQESVHKHRASHAERLHKCDDCGKSFQNAYTLRVHRRIHTNEKPFFCSKCGEAFAHKCLLKAHDEKKHAD